MPCYKCSNNKYKYGEKGRCVFDTLESCKAAERAVNARENKNFDDECTKEVKNSDLKNKTY
jgi:hypothetical protein